MAKGPVFGSILATCLLLMASMTVSCQAEKESQKPSPPQAAKAEPGEPLLSPALANETAPEQFRVRFVTSKGDFVMEATRSLSPQGVDRLYNLVRIGYFTDVAFFRVLDGFMAQFGIHGDPAVSARWRTATLKDEPVRESNVRGMVSYAMGGANSRSTQYFINYADNSNLDAMGFSPIGKVVEGMDVVESLYSEYGEGAPRGRGPDQSKIQSMGNTYLKAEFPQLDYILKAELLK